MKITNEMMEIAGASLIHTKASIEHAYKQQVLDLIQSLSKRDQCKIFTYITTEGGTRKLVFSKVQMLEKILFEMSILGIRDGCKKLDTNEKRVKICFTKTSNDWKSDTFNIPERTVERNKAWFKEMGIFTYSQAMYCNKKRKQTHHTVYQVNWEVMVTLVVEAMRSLESGLLRITRTAKKHIQKLLNTLAKLGKLKEETPAKEGNSKQAESGIASGIDHKHSLNNTNKELTIKEKQIIA